MDDDGRHGRHVGAAVDPLDPVELEAEIRADARAERRLVLVAAVAGAAAAAVAALRWLGA
ncbi:hypothetical protein [Cellulomonas composti]|nr:hypothetical protein [Cellulomonas composti]